MKASEALSAYAVVLSVSERMHAAALAGDWELVAQLEQERSARIEQIKAIDLAVVSDEQSRRRLAEMIRIVLKRDDEVRARAMDHMAQLKGMSDSIRQEQRLHRAYGK